MMHNHDIYYDGTPVDELTKIRIIVTNLNF